MELVIATRNAGKLKEIRRLLEAQGVVVLGLDQFPELPDVVEDGDTFAANASKKAEEVARATGLPCLADDSGLTVAALDARVDELVAVLLERSSLTQVASKAMIDEVVREGKVKPKTTLQWETEMDKSGEVREGVAAFLAKRPVRWPWRRH